MSQVNEKAHQRVSGCWVSVLYAAQPWSEYQNTLYMSESVTCHITLRATEDCLETVSSRVFCNLLLVVKTLWGWAIFPRTVVVSRIKILWDATEMRVNKMSSGVIGFQKKRYHSYFWRSLDSSTTAWRRKLLIGFLLLSIFYVHNRVPFSPYI